jgi:hypothetical protein
VLAVLQTMLRTAEQYQRTTAAAASARLHDWQEKTSSKYMSSELRRLLGDALLKEHTAETALRRQSRAASSSTAVQRDRVKTKTTATHRIKVWRMHMRA